MKAIDLLTGHDQRCTWAMAGGGEYGCTCRLSERQAEAREIDARVEALERFKAAIERDYVVVGVDAMMRRVVGKEAPDGE